MGYLNSGIRLTEPEYVQKKYLNILMIKKIAKVHADDLIVTPFGALG